MSKFGVYELIRLVEFSFIHTFFTEEIAKRFTLGGAHSFRINYDLIPYIALSENIHYILPSIIDWSFEGNCYYDPETNDIIDNDFGNIHPPWRFIKLYNALKEYISKRELNGIEYLSLVNIVEIKKEIFEIAKLKPDNIDDTKSWICSINNKVLKRVFNNNYRVKTDMPHAFATFPSNINYLMNKAHMPMLFYRDNVITNKTPTSSVYPKNMFEVIFLNDFAKKTFALNRMIEGVKPLCPHCMGTEYYSPIGINNKNFPPVGQQTRISESLVVSDYCMCSYANSFKEFWGVLPENITTI